MVLSTRDGVEGLDGGKEVTDISFEPLQNSRGSPWDKLCTLVDELVEGVLTVGSALSPDDRLRVRTSFEWTVSLTPVS